MRKMIQWAAIVFSIAGVAQALTVDFGDINGPNGTSTNGCYYWSDSNNWAFGTVPGQSVTNAPRFRYTASQKVYVDNDYSYGQISSLAGITGHLAGTNTLTLLNYLTLDGAGSAFVLNDAVRVIANNRATASANCANSAVSVTLNNSSYLSSHYWAFYGTNTTLNLTANDNAIYEETAFMVNGTNLSSASSFTFNGNSEFVVNGSTAAELETSWLQYGLTINLNDTALIDLQTSGSNAADIAALNAAGKLVINGSSNAVSGVDYTYDAGTGILQAIPEPATIGLLITGAAVAMLIRRR